MSLLKDMLTSGSGVSSKRVYGGAGLAVFLSMGYILQWRRTPIANTQLFSSWMDYLFWFIVACILGITFEKAAARLGVKGSLEGAAAVKKADKGTQDVNIANVEEQTVTTN